MPEALMLLLVLATPAVAHTTITVHAPHAVLKLQVARTESERERGLMFQSYLPAHAGMLFVFDADGPVAFWMKNTLLPLDMIFAGADGRVRSVATDVPIAVASETDVQIPRRYGTAKYVIELCAHEAARDGIKPGVLLRDLVKLK